MHFHLVGIKEKWDSQYELDFLLSWWDDTFIKNFLSQRWIVVVSFDVFKEEPTTFGNISMTVPYKGQEIQIIMPWEDLSERLYFVIFLWLTPTYFNFIDNPIPESEMEQLINSTSDKIKLLNQQLKQQEEEQQQIEQKKYEEKAIKDWLKIINHNIDHIEQLIKAWEWIILWTDKVKLENSLNEMKKIRLWTNFNKMTNIIIEAQELIQKVEPEILQAYDSKKFLVDKNSSVTNIDVIYENRVFNKISERTTVMPKLLNTWEIIRGVIWFPTILFQLLKRDISYTFQQTSFVEFFHVLMNLCEYFVLTWIISITTLWVIAPIFGFQDFSLYLLPACWRLWLLIYLFNSLKLKSNIALISGFIVLAIIYWRGLLLLLNTFAM